MSQANEHQHPTTTDEEMIKHIAYLGLLVAVTACFIGFVAGAVS